ncbi:MAG: sensor histidine kinase [Longimicrobiales bacterium]
MATQQLTESVRRIPLFYRLIIANGAVAVLAILGSAALVANSVRANPHADAARVVWPLILAAIAAAGVVNAFLVALALKPLRNLTTTAEQVRSGVDSARAEPSTFADAEMERVLLTFNAMLDSVSAYRRRLREVAIRAIDAGETERLRVSHELHNGAAQSLAAALVQLKIARASADPVCAANLEEVSGQMSAAIEEIRSLAHELRPPALDMIGLGAAILAHARNVSETTGVRVEAHVGAVDDVLSPEAELALYRLLQEALLNVVKHGDTRRAIIDVRCEAGAVIGVVTDEGRGFDVSAAAAQGAVGLFGMQERAAYVGGRIRVHSGANEGTTVRIEIPARGTNHG